MRGVSGVKDTAHEHSSRQRSNAERGAKFLFNYEW